MTLIVQSTGAELERLAGFLSWIGSPDARGKLTHAASLALHKETMRTFRQEKDPNNGQFWKKSARARAQGGKTLRDTSRLISSIYRRHNVNEATIGTRLWYAVVHQEGRVITPRNGRALRFQVGGHWVTAARVVIPRRRFLPEGDTLPPAYRAAVVENMRKVINARRRRL